MNLSLGKDIAVSTSYIKSNPAVPVYKDDEIYGIIYHIEIGYNENKSQKVKQYIIVDYKDFDLDNAKKSNLIDIAKKYCEEKNINYEVHIELLDNDEAENFIEKILNNMNVIKGLITKKG